jgi:outer membrane protein OmpA-like peptidoglycan-associated protein
MKRSPLPYFFLGLAAVLAISALVLLIVRPGMTRTSPTEPPVAITQPGEVKTPPTKTDPVQPPAVPANPPVAPENPPVIPADTAGRGVASADPADLVQQIAKALEAGDLATLERLLGKNALDPQTLARLKALGATGLRLRPQGGIHEIGELELNTRTRWALELEGQPPGRDRIFLDLRRDGQKWTVEKITLPPAPGEPLSKIALTDPMGVADALIQALLKQDFELAREFVDSKAVSDAKIAGLCILFEDGGYQLRKSKPLRAMFQRPDTTGYLAYVETQDASQSAQFSLTLKQAPAPANWRVSEINLDALLADYARRVAGGDLYYSPLVKNPAGGDTIALYFEFDEDSMNPRTARQLQIVSRILRADSGKKLTLSGHTDAVGTDTYNHDLSSRRADVVRDFLIKEGVASTQIVTIAKGSSQPRRPNVTETGKDDPAGRRANRRTEIYLDF